VLYPRQRRPSLEGCQQRRAILQTTPLGRHPLEYPRLVRSADCLFKWQFHLVDFQTILGRIPAEESRFHTWSTDTRFNVHLQHTPVACTLSRLLEETTLPTSPRPSILSPFATVSALPTLRTLQIDVQPLYSSERGPVEATSHGYWRVPLRSPMLREQVIITLCPQSSP